MAYNGSGVFLINSAGQPVVANTVISATVFNALTSDLATGLSTAITKDGQTTITNNIPFGSNKITGLGSGTAAADAANLGQAQSTVAKLITVTGTDTITGSMSPQLTAYAAGQLFYFVANAANTGAVTINIDSLGAKSITRDGSSALAAGDINSGEVVVVIYDGTRFQMINAANSFGNTTINGTLTVTGNTALQANVSITSTLSVHGTFGVTGAATLGSTLAVTGKSDLPTVSTASVNAAVAAITTATVTNLTATSASVASVNAGVALLTTATVTNLTATGASIASANIGNLQFTAASIASINAGVAVITNLTATGASIASANVGTAVITGATVTGASIASVNAGTAVITALTVTGASVASANFGNVVTTTERVTNLSVTNASVASINAAVALITTGTVTSLTSTGASIASANVGVGVITALTVTGASVASANVGTAVVTGLTVTGASIASVNVGAAVFSGNLTLNGGTANGVLYLNASKVATSGSALVFDGTNLGIGTASPAVELEVQGSASLALFRNNTSSAATSYITVVNANNSSNGLVMAHINDGTGYFGTQSNTALRFVTNDTERMRLDSAGSLGIGTTSPIYKLHVENNAASTTNIAVLNTSASSGAYAQVRVQGDAGIGYFGYAGSGNAAGGLYDADCVYLASESTAAALCIGTSGGSAPIRFFTNGSTAGSERMRLTSSGEMLVGSTAANAKWYNASTYTAQFQVEKSFTGGATASQYLRAGLITNVNDSNGSFLGLAKSRGTTDASYTIVADGDSIGTITFQGADGSEFVQAASISAAVDGTPGANDMPGRLVFNTTADGAATPSERMRITSAGELLVGVTARVANAGVIQVSNGITFPATQSASSNANTLDDYEEGTFTPIIKGRTTAGTGTYTYQFGSYVKVGKLVTVSVYIEWSAHTGTGQMAFAGLPFNATTTALYNSAAAFSYVDNIALTANNVLTGNINQTNNDGVNCWQYPVGGGGTTAVPVDGAGAVIFTVSYEV